MRDSSDPVGTGVLAGGELGAVALRGIVKAGPSRAILAAIAVKETVPGGFQIVEETLKQRAGEVGLGLVLSGALALPAARVQSSFAELVNAVPKAALANVIEAVRADPLAASVAEKFSADPTFFGEDAARRLARGFAGDEPLAAVLADLRQDPEFVGRARRIGTGTEAGFRQGARLNKAIRGDFRSGPGGMATMAGRMRPEMPIAGPESARDSRRRVGRLLGRFRPCGILRAAMAGRPDSCPDRWRPVTPRQRRDDAEDAAAVAEQEAKAAPATEATADAPQDAQAARWTDSDVATFGALTSELAAFERDAADFARVRQQIDLAAMPEDEAKRVRAQIANAERELAQRHQALTGTLATLKGRAAELQAHRQGGDLEAERQKLLSSIPDFDGPRLTAYLEAQGFKRAELAELRDSRMAAVAEKARRYDELAASGELPGKTVKNAAGKARAVETVSPEIAEAEEKARHAGYVEHRAIVVRLRREAADKSGKARRPARNAAEKAAVAKMKKTGTIDAIPERLTDLRDAVLAGKSLPTDNEGARPLRPLSEVGGCLVSRPHHRPRRPVHRRAARRRQHEGRPARPEPAADGGDKGGRPPTAGRHRGSEAIARAERILIPLRRVPPR